MQYTGESSLEIACTILAGSGKWGQLCGDSQSVACLVWQMKAERGMITVKYVVGLTSRKEESYLH